MTRARMTRARLTREPTTRRESGRREKLAPKERPAPPRRGPGGVDLRLLPSAAAAWGCAGAAVALSPGELLAGVVAVLVLAGLLAASLVLRRPGGRHDGPGRRIAAGVLLALAAAGLVLASTAAQAARRSGGVLVDLVAQEATVEARAVIRGDPRRVRPASAPDEPDRGGADGAAQNRADRADRVVVVVEVQRVRGRGVTGSADAPVLVVGTGAWAGVQPGEVVQAAGRLVRSRPGDDVAALLVARGPPTVTEPAGVVQRTAGSLRAGLRDAASGLPPDAAGLLPGLVVGDTSGLPPDLEEAMRAVGLTHLTAVSGSNVAIVCGAALLVAAAAGAGRTVRVGLAAAALAGFVVLARPDPSVLRAAVMGAVALLGLLVGRARRGVPALCAAVVVLCAADPWLARRPGFALSVLATGGLLLLAPGWARLLARRVPLPMAQAVAVPAAAQAVCAPVIALLTPQLALAAVPANLLVAPAVAPATVLGVAATLLAPVWPAGASAVAWAGGVGAWWVAVVARATAALPGASVPWPQGARGALPLVAVTGLLVAGGALLARGRSGDALGVGPTERGGRARRAGAAARRRPCGPLAAVPVAGVTVVAVLVTAGLVVAGGLVGLAVQRRLAPQWPPSGWVAVACDVGQGDMFVVASGPGSAVVVDTGPDPRAARRCLDDLAVTTVDLLVLSHFHADHVDGLDGVLAGRSVRGALTSPLAAPRPAARRVAAALAAVSVPVTDGTTGVTGATGTLTWQVLWPPEATGGGPDPGPVEGTLANDASVVLAVQAPGLRVVATGDLETEAQRALARSLPRDQVPVDVLKVAHHGSARQDPGLHERWDPRVALVSVGAGNDYGHPAPSTLGLLAGAVVARTDQGGDVAVGVGGGSLWVADRDARGRSNLSIRDAQGESRAGSEPSGVPASRQPTGSASSSGRRWRGRVAVAGCARGSPQAPGPESLLAGGRAGGGRARDGDRGVARRPGRGRGPDRAARGPPRAGRGGGRRRGVCGR